jgi:hypothetical protein
MAGLDRAIQQQLTKAMAGLDRVIQQQQLTYAMA